MFKYGTVEGGNTHETIKRNYKRIHDFIQHEKFFKNTVADGVTAIKKEYVHIDVK
jgi:hypothetical protein